MSDSYLQLRSISFRGPKAQTELSFEAGINVICGASDTGKSFLADSIDFMLGGSALKEIPERSEYDQLSLCLAAIGEEDFKLRRSMSGGNFQLFDLSESNDADPTTLKQNHAHNKTDNLSGYLLDKIGLLGKRIIKSKAKGTTQSLSFRNLARLVIVQEGEIQRTGSPFWSGQYTTKTSEIATVKLLLTGIDDSSVIPDADKSPDNTRQIALIDELLSDLQTEIEDLGEDREELDGQLEKLEGSIKTRREELSAYQKALDELVGKRRELFEQKQEASDRLDEISDLLARFRLLAEHYDVDLKRLTAIQESGSMFAHVEQVACPLCGADPDAQHLDETCDGDVEAVVTAATAEIEKIQRLQAELDSTVAELTAESEVLSASLEGFESEYSALNEEIQSSVGPDVTEVRASFSALIEERSSAQRAADLFVRFDKLVARKTGLLEEDDVSEYASSEVTTGIPESVAHAFSSNISEILKAWHFPGECHVYYDKNSSDFVIDGKPRSSRGKGLRAITHAAVSVALLEYCQSNGLSHPGFVVLDSPLLAYFEPEGDEELALSGTDLKERFYDYLIEHHGKSSQVIIIENQHPPSSIKGHVTLTVFTGNPKSGRYGLL
jgi:predicted  nucleic acid-binding Zn-ribbon protein